ncbi:TPA: DGQHR domain-containing protein [Vibrio parahaemolyticus]|nr:DGQHR domain-containing protein [Vibrio parahaemolyticus]
MRIPCIRVEQPLGEFYLASIESSLLSKVTYSRATNISDGVVTGNQRAIDDKRVGDISSYLKTREAAVPNSIILAVNHYENDELEVDPDKAWSIVEENGFLYIDIPDENIELAAIVDGQHRVKGLESGGLNMQIPCSIYFGLPRSLQALVFSTINFNQKKVDKSLAYQLFGYQLDEGDKDFWPPDIVAVKLSRSLNEKENSPFKDRIQLIKKQSENGGEYRWSISSAAFISGVLSLLTTNAKADRYKIGEKKIIGYNTRKSLKENSNCPLRSYYLDGNDLAIEMVIHRFFSSMKKTLWVGRSESDIVFRTVGVAAQFSLLKDLLLKGKVTLNSELDFDELLACFQDINIDSEYFSPRTATKKRLLDVFRLRLALIKPEGLDEEIIRAAAFK